MQAVGNHFQSIVYLICGIMIISSLSMLWVDATILNFMGMKLTIEASGWGIIGGDIGWIGMTGPVCVLIAGIVMILCPLIAFGLPRMATGADEIVELIGKGARTIPTLAIFGVVYFYFDAKNFEGCVYIPDDWIGYAVWVAGPFAVLGAIFGITRTGGSVSMPLSAISGGPVGTGQNAGPYRSVRRQRLEQGDEGGKGTPVADESMDAAKEHFMRAAEHKSRKEYDEAIEAYSQAIAADPSYAMALFNRGSVYMIQNRPEEALADFQKVVEITADPELSGMAQRRINDLTL